MKKIILLFTIGFVGFLNAQTKYQTGMQKAFQLWEQNKTEQASQLFERISKAEQDNWLPPYYAANIEIIGSFGLKDGAKLDAKLKKAKLFIEEAEALSPNNPEIIITKALLNTAYISFDGQKYGRTLSGENSQLYAKALTLAPKNPRVVLRKAEWDMGMARFFGKSMKPYCNAIKKSMKLAEKEEITTEFYPKYQKKRALEVLKQCEE